MTIPRGFLPTGISSTRVVSDGSLCTVAFPLASTASFTTMLLAALTTYAVSALFLKAMAQGWVMNSLEGLVCALTADCMLMVWPASLLVVTLITLNRLWTFTLKRTGPLGEAPVLGRYAKLPCVARLFNWLG